MGRSLFTHLVILQAVGLGVVAMAGTDRGFDRDRNVGLARLQAREEEKVDVRGFLTCTLAEVNNGKPCTLSLINSANGESLRVIGGNEAMSLYQAGKTEVVATGAISGDTIRISSISTIE